MLIQIGEVSIKFKPFGDIALMRYNHFITTRNLSMKLLSTEEVAQFISELTGKRMSKRQVQHEIAIGKIKAKKIGHSYVVNETDLKHYKRRHRGPPAKK